ncbi:AMP-dependent synthetase and ligase [Rhodococcus ruber BKS 20-38]|uniref:AMP-dependent synthetase and ligase n=1 Tax=Rhodococcus ruber BKS 20-38 TaxID=1278076 RepID=M2YYY4_9NOCA|nr:AMP-dependent synthetase and ligase [Rhodococcus ruber BKS 20-38]
MRWRHTGWIDYQASQVPDKTAIADLSTGLRRTYGEIADRVARLAGHLTELGIERGDRVAVLSHNNPNVFELLYACASVGAILVPMNWRLSVHELCAIADDFDPAAVFFDEENRNAVQALLKNRAMPVVRWGGDADAYEVALAASTPRAALTTLDENEPWLIIYTSGTTGLPKGAVHTFRSVRANIENSAFAGHVDSSSVVLSVLPTFHVAGLHLYANAALMHGGSVLMTRGFDAAQTLQLFADDERAITHFCGVPAMFQFMSALPEFDEIQLRPITVSVGGSPVPAAMIRKWSRSGVRMSPVYGATEAGSTLLTMPVNADSAKGVGIPAIHAEASVRTASGEPTEQGEVGELWLRGPMTMLGYWGRPEETEKAITPDGWFRTGDAARCDENGIYHIVDRWKDMYISGGENVYPAEIENVLYQHPDIVLASVIGVDNEKWGEVGHAFVVCAAGRAIDPDELRSWCRERLAPFKVPASFSFRKDLPRNATGKILKSELRSGVA